SSACRTTSRVHREGWTSSAPLAQGLQSNQRRSSPPSPRSSRADPRQETFAVSEATLTISSKNYSSWSLRGWLLARFAGLPFEEIVVPPDDADARKELLLLSPSILVPRLTHGGVKIWDTLAIGEYLNEIKPRAGLLPSDRAARAHCRAVCGEMHSGFSSLRSALPMNLKRVFHGHKVWLRAPERVTGFYMRKLECCPIEHVPSPRSSNCNGHASRSKRPAGREPRSK